MPTANDAIVVCSCLKKWGSLSRASSCEEMQDLEQALVASSVSELIRHWQLGHKLRGRGGLAMWALILRAAKTYKENA